MTCAPGLGEALPQVETAQCIYLDYNGTTPVWAEVAAAAAPYLHTHFGNPSSGHAYGSTVSCSAVRPGPSAWVRLLPLPVLSE